jgi:hypothetical protein
MTTSTFSRRMKMPGPQVKDWALYHKLIKEGHSKESAARIANAQANKRDEDDAKSKMKDKKK